MNLEDLDGLTDNESCRNLQTLAATVADPAVIVEVGAFRGRTAIWMASQASVPVYAVDPWDLGTNDGGHRFYDPAHREAFDRQVAASGYADRIHPIQAFSTDVAASWTLPVGLLHIDGWHDLEAITEDVEAWGPHVVSGGTVVIDDYGNQKCPDVRRYVDEVMRHDRRWRTWKFGWQAQAVRK